MTRFPGRTRGRTPVLAWALPVLLIVVVLTPGAAGVPSSSTPSTSALDAQSFAARAGFSPALLQSLSDPVPATGSMSVVVTFTPTSPALFDVPAAAAAPLTATEIGERFGLSWAAYESAEQYFVGQGLSIQHAGVDRLSLTVEGP
ncbi:MAG TPA: hypothetical protein VN842_00520, partial [Thermoplasmata archaeon]|nr:hypothetical protein [Thermoplasmata archaeon]